MTANWHIVTGEYPPMDGGVGDYTFLVAGALGSSGDRVIVWCSAGSEAPCEQAYVAVNSELGALYPSDLWHVEKLMAAMPGPRRILVEWVPHAFGMRAVNLPFCLWVLQRRILSGDAVDLMIHEPFLGIRGSRRQRLAAIVQRIMMTVLLLAARHVWVSIPRWWVDIRPFALGRRLNVGWLPLPSNMPLRADPIRVQALRSKHAFSGGTIGHFGLFGPYKDEYIAPYVREILERCENAGFMLIGPGSTATRTLILSVRPSLEGRIVAVDGVAKPEAVCRLAACDVLVQPFPDGISSRRTSVMSGLALGLATVTHEGESTEGFWERSGAVLLTGSSPIAYAEKVDEVLRDAEKRRKVGIDAMKLYEQKFQIRHVVERLRVAGVSTEPRIDVAIVEWESRESM